MQTKKRKALEAKGWKVGDAADFLELSAEERQLLDFRAAIATAVRRRREALELSQKELGARINTTQPRMAKIERAAADVSMDQLLKAFAAAGGKIVVKTGKKGTKRTAQADALVLEVAE